jgi:hypothetical protein
MEALVPCSSSASCRARVLLRLSALQTELGTLYAEMARRQHDAERSEPVGEHGGHDPANPGTERASLALREAAQYSADAAAALTRARSADEVAQWFEEIRLDERI